MKIIESFHSLFIIILLALVSTSCYSEWFTKEKIDKEMDKWREVIEIPNLPKIQRLVDTGDLSINITDKKGVECSVLSTVLIESYERELPNFSYPKDLTKEEINLRNKERWDIVRYLLVKNASLCKKHPYHSNLSRYAVNHPDILRELLKRGDDPDFVYIDPHISDHTFNYERTAILSALSVEPAKKRFKVIKMLLEHGASATNLDVDHIDYPYYIPIVSEGMYSQDTSLKWRVKIINLLIRYGAKIKVLTYTKDGKKKCNFQAAIFQQEAIERNKPEMLALWQRYNTNAPYKYCKPDDFSRIKK